MELGRFCYRVGCYSSILVPNKYTFPLDLVNFCKVLKNGIFAECKTFVVNIFFSKYVQLDALNHVKAVCEGWEQPESEVCLETKHEECQWGDV